MKYCTHCGSEIVDEAVVCPNCGCSVENPQTAVATTGGGTSSSGLDLVIKIFMVLSCIAQGWAIIPLLWCIPMTVSVFGKMKRGEHIGTGFKVCVLLFVNIISGICLLCRNED